MEQIIRPGLRPIPGHTHADPRGNRYGERPHGYMFVNAQRLGRTSLWCKMVVLAAACVLAERANAQLTGTKNIPGDYATLATAVSALNTQGVGAGGVVINLLAGNAQTAPAGGYVIGGAGSLVLTTASSSKPISIVGNGNTLTAPSPQPSGNLNDGIFKLIGADWTTISGFTMLENASNTGTTAGSNNMTEWGVALLYVTSTDGAQNNTIQNNTIDLNRSYQNTFGIYSNSTHTATSVSTSATATGAAGGNDNLRIYSNTITDVNNGIVHVGPTAAADHNITADIGGTTAPQGNIITNFGTTGTFSSYVNVSGSVNGVLVRNTRNFNISWNSITSQNSGTLTGTLNGIQIPDASNPVIGTLTQTMNNNSLSLRKGSTSGINGITMTGAGNSVNSTTACNMNGNNFHTFGHTVSTSSDIFFMNQSGNPLVQTFDNNTFTNISVNTTGQVLFFRYVNSMIAGASLSISNNAIVGGFTRTSAGQTTVWGVSSTSSVNGSAHTIASNNFSNINLTGASEFIGFMDWDGNSLGGPTKTITGNTFSGITTGAQLVTPLSVDFAAPSSTVSNNTITSITSTLTTGAMAVVYLGSGNKTGLVCSGNTIASINSAAPFLYGIQIQASNVTLSKNRIHGLSTSSATGSGWVTAIQVQTSSVSSTVTVSNNLVGNLTAPACTNPNGVIGINMSGNAGTSSFRVYYNSIYLNALTSGAGFGSSGIQAAASATASTSTLDMRNNIVVNTSVQNGAGLTVAYRRTLGTAGTLANYASTSNNNLFYAGTPSATHLIYADGTSTAQSITDYKNGVFAAGTVSPRDGASKTENPPFLSTSGASADFLHFATGASTLVESGGANVAGITDDYDNQTRQGNGGYAGTGNAPDIGADEFEGVVGCTPPTANPPAVANASCGNYDITVTITSTSDSPGGVVNIQVDGNTVTTQGVGGPYNLGTYLNGSTHSVSLVHLGDPLCSNSLGNVTSNISCDDGNPTTTDICVNNTCQHNPTPCDDGDPCTTNDVLVLSSTTQNFDGVTAPALPSGWSSGGTGTTNFWVTATDLWFSSPNSAKVGGVGSVSEYNITSPVIGIASPSAQLTFRNRFEFEFFATEYYDGGILEISINGGAFVGILAAGGSFVTGGYGGTISSAYSNPIGGQQAWVADNTGSPAFMVTTVNLPAAAAGGSIQLRWRFGADNAVASTGWWIDDIAISDVDCQGTLLDTDSDGTPDCTDPCPLLANLVIGDPCDDGNATTVNDVVQANCTCAGTAAMINLSARVLLEGPYNSATGLMSNALRSLGAFPPTDPYPGLGYTHTGGGNGGSVAPAVLAVTGNGAIVDWVLVELRSAAAPASIIASRSVLVQRDGDIVELDGTSPVAFAVAPNNYYVAVRQRNHLGCMTASVVALGAAPVPVDFTTSGTATYGTQARKSVPGTFPAEVLWAGDVSFDGVIKYTGSGNDRDPILVTVGSTTPNNVVSNAYSTRDVNLNGEVKYTGSGNDRDPILVNVGSTTPNNLRIQQLP